MDHVYAEPKDINRKQMEHKRWISNGPPKLSVAWDYIWRIEHYDVLGPHWRVWTAEKRVYLAALSSHIHCHSFVFMIWLQWFLQLNYSNVSGTHDHSCIVDRVQLDLIVCELYCEVKLSASRWYIFFAAGLGLSRARAFTVYEKIHTAISFPAFLQQCMLKLLRAQRTWSSCVMCIYNLALAHVN